MGNGHSSNGRADATLGAEWRQQVTEQWQATEARLRMLTENARAQMELPSRLSLGLWLEDRAYSERALQDALSYIEEDVRVSTVRGLLPVYCSGVCNAEVEEPACVVSLEADRDTAEQVARKWADALLDRDVCGKLAGIRFFDEAGICSVDISVIDCREVRANGISVAVQTVNKDSKDVDRFDRCSPIYEVLPHWQFKRQAQICIRTPDACHPGVAILHLDADSGDGEILESRTSAKGVSAWVDHFSCFVAGCCSVSIQVNATFNDTLRLDYRVFAEDQREKVQTELDRSPSETGRYLYARRVGILRAGKRYAPCIEPSDGGDEKVFEKKAFTWLHNSDNVEFMRCHENNICMHRQRGVALEFYLREITDEGLGMLVTSAISIPLMEAAEVGSQEPPMPRHWFPWLSSSKRPRSWAQMLSSLKFPGSFSNDPVSRWSQQSALPGRVTSGSSECAAKDASSSSAALREAWEKGAAVTTCPPRALPSHIKPEVVEATIAAARNVARKGLGAGRKSGGNLFIVGNAEMLLRTTCEEDPSLFKFGNIIDESLDFKSKSYDIRTLEEDSDARSGFNRACGSTGGIIIDGTTGQIRCGSWLVHDFTMGKAYGGARSNAASSIALQAGGCYAIKISEDNCGNDETPPPRDASLEIYNCSNEKASKAIYASPTELPFHTDHIRQNVADATVKAARKICREGVGERQEAHGLLFIVGKAHRLIAEMENGFPKFGKINNRMFDFRELNLNVRDLRDEALKSFSAACKEDGAIIIDGLSGKICAGNWLVGKMQFAQKGLRARSAAASSIAVQADGCFVVKASGEFCAHNDKPLPENAKLEVFICTNQRRHIPILEG
eukprot:TRINITY_DN76032_c0_g1_i1.p1 TRINITY_DN76032_c0_g1~~TRINITY_DN76032_c0_g1_i1.p1  ORF type:complete len:862 (-),score=119.23 TRINITY_DN76032_c0_g1_i1:79-2613(-)